MISIETYREIQKHKNYGASMHKTSQIMKLSYNTVYKWWNLTEEDFFSFQSRHEFILDNYRQYFIEQLRITPQMNNTLLYKRLKNDFDNIDVPVSTFHRYIKNLREQTGLVKPKRQTGLRDNPDPGYEAQADYGQYVMKTMYGNNVRIYFFCMVLSYSRMKFVYFLPEPFNAAKAIDAHMYAFRYFGGRPQMIVYDQDRCVCVNENFGEIVFVKEFEEFIRDTGFSVYLCRKNDPQTKGRVENVINVVKRDFLDGRLYYGCDELNMSCLAWLDGFGNGQVNERTRKIPRDMFASEYPKLQQVYELKSNDVMVLTPDCNVVMYQKNCYELPPGKVSNDDRVRVEKHGGMILIYHALTNDLVCKHVIPKGEGNSVTLPKAEKTLSIEEELLLDYKEYPVAKEFFEKLRKRSPRYVYPQCNKIRSLQKHYPEEQMIDGFEFCVREDNCSVRELCSYFLYRYGEEKSRLYIPGPTFRYYKDRADEIREVMLNGNGN
ncbi:MAG: IS21 family transposase [Saccharofermentanales bacterium]